MADEPASWAPSGASERAKKLWLLPIMERMKLAVNPDPETAQLFWRAGFESFTAPQLRDAIVNSVDLIPYLRAKILLDDGPFHYVAKSVIRIWWRTIYDIGMHPKRILDDLQTNAPDLYVVLNTPEGRRWLNATVFNVLNYLRWYAEIKGGGAIAPPPSIPFRLMRRALGSPRASSAVESPKT